MNKLYCGRYTMGVVVAEYWTGWCVWSQNGNILIYLKGCSDMSYVARLNTMSE